MIAGTHARLFAEHGVRHLDREGQNVFWSLRAAGLLDEVFLIETDVVVDEARQAGVSKMLESKYFARVNHRGTRIVTKPGRRIVPESREDAMITLPENPGI